MRELKPTIAACGLPREPFVRLIEANRMDQRISEYESWDDLREYCRHSADPVGRLVLGRRSVAPDDVQLVAWSDDVCTGLQLVNFLQDVPRDLAARPGLPACRGSAPVRCDRRSTGRTTALTQLLEFEADRARGLLAAGRAAARRDRRAHRQGGRALRARWPGGARRASRTRSWDIFNAATAAVAHAARPRRHLLRSSDDDRRAGVRRSRAADTGAGAELRVRDHAAAEAEAARDRGDLRLRARGRRHRGRSGTRRRGEAASGSRSCGRGSTADADDECDVRRARRRTPAISDPAARRSTTSSTAESRTRSRRATRRSTSSRATAGASPERSASPASRVYGAARATERAETLGVALQLINIIRDVAEDWDARARLPPAGRAGRVRRVRGGHRRRSVPVELAQPDGASGARARSHLAEGTDAAAAARPAQRCVRGGVREPLRGDARPDRGAGLRRLRRAAAPVGADEAAHRRDRGSCDESCRRRRRAGWARGRARARRRRACDVTLYEARPTLGGAVQTLPERDGDPRRRPTTASTSRSAASPSTCASSTGSARARSYRRLALELPVIAEDGRVATIGRSAASFLRYRHLSFRDRMRVANAVRRLPERGRPTQHVRRAAPRARLLGGVDRPLLGRLRATGAQSAAPTR